MTVAHDLKGGSLGVNVALFPGVIKLPPSYKGLFVSLNICILKLDTHANMLEQDINTMNMITAVNLSFIVIFLFFILFYGDYTNKSSEL